MPSPRRLRLPADVRGRLTLERGERPLAWASDRDGQWYVGTDRALHLADGDGFRRLVWEHVERADWQRDASRLAVIEVAAWGAPEPRTEIGVDDPGSLLELLRERRSLLVLDNLETVLEPGTSEVRYRPGCGIPLQAPIRQQRASRRLIYAAQP